MILLNANTRDNSGRNDADMYSDDSIQDVVNAERTIESGSLTLLDDCYESCPCLSVNLREPNQQG
jgi:hypothetical protein